ncbi:unnamed protein product [Orchesella dallaii]|uniref:Craniofacial development protein 2 n=1 Tax=Orchesella dallaii TaxID=48710 RepID=A0ABP1RRF5_9HEXA
MKTGFLKLVEVLLENKPKIIMGDLNARIGSICNASGSWKGYDNKINERGKKLNAKHQNELSEYQVCNGMMRGDIAGQFTFSNKNGISVVDFSLTKSVVASLASRVEVISNQFLYHSIIKLNPRPQINI